MLQIIVRLVSWLNLSYKIKTLFIFIRLKSKSFASHPARPAVHCPINSSVNGICIFFVPFQVDQDVLITNSYETAMRTAQNFLSIFLKK